MNIQTINFKKAFLAFFAALLLFSAVSFVFAASDGGWSEAVQLEQDRLETRARVSGHGDRMRAGHWRASTEIEAGGAPDEAVARTRGADNHLLRGLARTYVRVTAPEFGVFDVFGLLFRAVFTLLLALWVYVDTKKHGRNTILWTAITLVTSIVGFFVYLLAHRVRNAPAAKV